MIFNALSFFSPVTPRVKPWVIQMFLTFDSVDRTLKCNYSLARFEQYSTVELFILQFSPVCNFGKYINFGIGTVGTERVNRSALIYVSTLRTVACCTF